MFSKTYKYEHHLSRPSSVSVFLSHIVGWMLNANGEPISDQLSRVTAMFNLQAVVHSGVEIHRPNLDDF